MYVLTHNIFWLAKVLKMYLISFLWFDFYYTSLQIQINLTYRFSHWFVKFVLCCCEVYSISRQEYLQYSFKARLDRLPTVVWGSLRGYLKTGMKYEPIRAHQLVRFVLVSASRNYSWRLAILEDWSSVQTKVCADWDVHYKLLLCWSSISSQTKLENAQM